MQFTDIEYGVLMQAIENARGEVAEDIFIDHYNNEEGVTNEEVMRALGSAEEKLSKIYFQDHDNNPKTLVETGVALTL